MKKVNLKNLVNIESMRIQDIKATQIFENFGYNKKTFQMNIDSLNDTFYRVKYIIDSANVEQFVKDEKNIMLDKQFELLQLKSNVDFIKEIGYPTYAKLEQKQVNISRLMKMDKKRLKQELHAFKIRGIL